MMKYTESGLALIGAAVASGELIHFKRIELIADPERSAGSLTYTVDIVSVSKRDETVVLKVVTDNTLFTADYYFNKVNVYAAAESGLEILFCYQHTDTCPIYIPTYDGRSVQSEIEVYVTVGDAAAVSLVHDGAYVLQSDFEKMQGDLNELRDVLKRLGRVLVGAADTELEVNDTLYVIAGMPERFRAAAFDNVIFSASAPAAEYWAQVYEAPEGEADVGITERNEMPTIIMGNLAVSEEEPKDAAFYAKINK